MRLPRNQTRDPGFDTWAGAFFLLPLLFIDGEAVIIYYLFNSRRICLFSPNYCLFPAQI